MIVVADTGPLNYLLLIDAVEILPQLYRSVLIPEEVRSELLHPDTPEIVRAWASSLPEWITVRQPHRLLPLSLDPGETAAISLAVESHIGLILIDDRRGRKMAQAQHLAVTGTLGILATAAENDLLNFGEMIARLKQTNFHPPESLVASLLIRFAPKQSI